MSKRKLLTWHRRIGLACALFFIVKGFTGVILALQKPLEGLAAPELELARSALPTLPLTRQIALARAARPGDTLLRAVYAKDPRDAPRFLFAQGRSGGFYMVALDPRNGAILREGGFNRWPIEWLLRLHSNLLIGAPGQIVLGAEGAGLIVLVLLGWQLWWPGKKRLRAGFKVVRSAGAERLIRSMHRVAGGGGAVLLLFMAVTGTIMCWTPNPLPHYFTQHGALGARTLDAALTTWSLRHHGAQPARIIFAQDRIAPTRVDWRYSGAASLTSTRIALTAQGYAVNGARSKTSDFPALPAVALRLHSGKAMAPVGAVLTLAAALTLVFLSASGLWAWRRSARRSFL